jgi:hypothetical protein
VLYRTRDREWHKHRITPPHVAPRRTPLTFLEPDVLPQPDLLPDLLDLGPVLEEVRDLDLGTASAGIARRLLGSRSFHFASLPRPDPSRLGHSDTLL